MKNFLFGMLFKEFPDLGQFFMDLDLLLGSSGEALSTGS
jgi:hypothetical protein